MNLAFSTYNIAILLGGIQGVILSLVLLFSKRKPNNANRFLALLVFIMGFTNMELFRNDSHLDELLELPFSIPYLWLGFGPALYFYTIRLIKPSLSLSPKGIFHFLPLIVECSYYLSSELWINETNLKLHHWVIIPLESYLSMFSAAVYAVLSYRILTSHKVRAKKKELKLDKQLILLQWLIYSIAVILALWFVINLHYDYYYRILNYTANKSDLEAFFPVLMVLTIVIYTVGFSGYYRGDTLVPFKQESHKEKPKPNTTIDISEQDMAVYIGKIKKAMEEDKLYLNPDLNLTYFANHLEINSKYLSYILNSGLNKKFNDFVNEYRVEEFKRRVLKPENDHLTIIGIAMDSGFNSKSAFNRIFKNLTQMSPKEYRNQH